MRNPRHQLILLGFICQGLSWDDYMLPLANALLWVLCLTLPRKPFNPPPVVEAGAVFGGVVAGYAFSTLMGQNTHFSFGHGITVIQALRLLRPLTYREKVLSVLMSLFQIGVACTVILDYRFILIFFAMVWLLPKALLDAESARFAASPTPPARPRLAAYATIAGGAILFFLLFPRGIIGSPIQLNRGRASDPGSLLDNVLDPTRSGAAQSSRVIFSVEGHNIGYLRCYALTEFDGVRWTSEERSYWRPIEYEPPEKLANFPLRKVRAKTSSVFGRVLPTDGKVVYLRGSFFRKPFRNVHGIIECESIVNTANNVYEYRIDPHPKPERISPALIAQYTRYPRQSAALQEWLDKVLGNATAPTEQARKLEVYLRDHFTYRLGAPELNRLRPVDDFVFNQKEGHCERFASTLALLLRMKGIPSRVVIGYLPTSRNWISGWYDIRFKDAHAWTEAYFKDLGWVQFDATPGSSRTPSGFDMGEFMEAIDFAWYANVVNFDASTQSQLFSVSIESLGLMAVWFRNHAAILLGLVLLPIFYIAWRRRRTRSGAGSQRRQAQILASHYYGQMLRVLAHKGFDREPHTTPLEFLATLQAHTPPCIEDIELITRLFCASRYGDVVISATDQAEIESALARIRKMQLEPVGA